MALPVSDNFNRASLGSNWTVMRGVISMPGSVAAMADSLGNHSTAWWNADTFGADQFAEIVISNANFNGYMGVAVRCDTGGAVTLYGYHGSQFEQSLFKFVAGTYTLLGNDTVNVFANGDVIRLEIVGTSLVAKQNGVTRFSVTDSDIASGAAGIQGYTSTSGTNTSADSFAANNLTADDGPITDISWPDSFPLSDGAFYGAYDQNWFQSQVVQSSTISDYPATVYTEALDLVPNIVASDQNNFYYSGFQLGMAIDDLNVGATIAGDSGFVAGMGRDATLSTGASVAADRAIAAAIGRDAGVSVGATMVADKAVVAAAGRDAALSIGVTIAADKAVAVGIGRDGTISTAAAATINADKAIAISAARDAAVSAGVGVTADRAIGTSLARDTSVSTGVGVTADRALGINIARNATISVGVNMVADRAIVVLASRNASISAGATVAADKAVVVGIGRNASVSSGVTVGAGPGIAVVVGRNAAVSTGVNEQAGKAVSVSAARDASISVGVTIQAGVAAVAMAGRDASVSTSVNLASSVGVVAAVARDASISAGVIVDANTAISIALARDAGFIVFSPVTIHLFCAAFSYGGFAATLVEYGMQAAVEDAGLMGVLGAAGLAGEIITENCP